MKVGFLLNQLDLRGTGTAVYDYANFNELLLGNQSTIYTLDSGSHNPIAVKRFNHRFKVEYVDYSKGFRQIDVLYHIKYGNPDGMEVLAKLTHVPYAVHSVFAIDPHGDRYAAISNWLAADRVPFVPHIVNLPTVTSNLRDTLGISKDAIVFGRFGAPDTFDISWAWDAIRYILEIRDDVWFLFANTNEQEVHSRIVYLPEIETQKEKVEFINTSDYMLHARSRGETFGLAVGEFASKGVPIITWDGSGERAHLEQLGDKAITYNDLDDLVRILEGAEKPSPTYAYNDFTPFEVMQKFKEVFLD